jgi:hypothetical protein
LPDWDIPPIKSCYEHEHKVEGVEAEPDAGAIGRSCSGGRAQRRQRPRWRAALCTVHSGESETGWRSANGADGVGAVRTAALKVRVRSAGHRPGQPYADGHVAGVACARLARLKTGGSVGVACG